MNHLSDEQFEDILDGTVPDAAHLSKCPQCNRRLEEHAAVRSRLRSAFASLEAGTALAERIRRDLPAQKTRQLVRLHRRVWPRLAAAAAVLLVAVPLVLYFAWPNSASASPAAGLAKIHEHNLASRGEFYSEADPAKLADYLETRLGFVPAFPRLDQGMSLRGCCLVHFRGKIVGSYVVDTPQGIISVIVVTDDPETLGLKNKVLTTGRTFWTGSYAQCNMATVWLDRYSYCAVGQLSIPHKMLVELLARLVRRVRRVEH